MSEHTPLTEAEVKVDEAIAKWEDRGPTSLTVALLAEAVYAARDALAARTSTATADTGHKAGCQEYPTGWLCVSDCTTVWHDKATADTGLRERVEALADEWETTVYKLPPGYPMTVNEFCRLWFKAPLRAILDATPASTEDRVDNEGTR